MAVTVAVVLPDKRFDTVDVRDERIEQFRVFRTFLRLFFETFQLGECQCRLDLRVAGVESETVVDMPGVFFPDTTAEFAETVMDEIDQFLIVTDKDAAPLRSACFLIAGN